MHIPPAGQDTKMKINVLKTLLENFGGFPALGTVGEKNLVCFPGQFWLGCVFFSCWWIGDGGGRGAPLPAIPFQTRRRPPCGRTAPRRWPSASRPASSGRGEGRGQASQPASGPILQPVSWVRGWGCQTPPRSRHANLQPPDLVAQLGSTPQRAPEAGLGRGPMHLCVTHAYSLPPPTRNAISPSPARCFRYGATQNNLPNIHGFPLSVFIFCSLIY